MDEAGESNDVLISFAEVNVLLTSVDVLKELMAAVADDIEPEMDRVNKVQAQFNAVLSGNETAAEELLDLSYDAN